MRFCKQSKCFNSNKNVENTSNNITHACLCHCQQKPLFWQHWMICLLNFNKSAHFCHCHYYYRKMNFYQIKYNTFQNNLVIASTNIQMVKKPCGGTINYFHITMKGWTMLWVQVMLIYFFYILLKMASLQACASVNNTLSQKSPYFYFE